MENDDAYVRAQLIRDQVRKVQRQVRILTQQVAKLCDDLQPKEAQGNGSNARKDQ